MNFSKFSMTHRPIVYALVAIVTVAGVSNFATMSRREDPAISIRSCIITTLWPGAPAEKVEDLVTDLIEKQVNQIAGVDDILSDSRVGLSVIQVDLEDRVGADEIDGHWTEVRNKVEEIWTQLPDGCRKPWVNSDFGDVYSSCYAVYQRAPEGGWTPGNEQYRYSMRQLEIYAELIEDEFLTVDEVAKVGFWGVQDERIYVEVDAADWAQLAVTPNELARLFDSRNIISPGGLINTPRASFAYTPTGNFTSVEEMRKLILDKMEGTLPVRVTDAPLEIDRRYVEPMIQSARFATPELEGQRCIIVGVSMKDQRNIVQMGENLTRKVAEIQARRVPNDLEIVLINDTPRQVQTLVSDFFVNLMQAVVIVMAVAFLMMGWRPALIMSTAVPLSMITAFAVVTMFGVELEQFSIASLIIALGMVVDNAIVVSDNTTRLLQEGKPRFDACVEGAQSLAVPILTSTATTVSAFLPMLLIPGDVGEFIYSLPVVVACTLISSYFVAMLVTPIMCYFVLKPKPLAAETAAAAKEPKYDRMLHWCLSHKLVVLGGAAAVFVASLQLMPIIGTQFFPPGDRDQFFIDVWLPEGASIDATEDVVKQVEEILRKHSKDPKDGTERLASAFSFIGTGGPRLLLTRSPEQTFPYYGFLVANTTDKTKTIEYVRDLRPAFAKIAGARIIAEPYMLGPPVDPVQFRLTCDDADVLRAKTDEILRVFDKTPGTWSTSSNWGAFGYQVTVDIDADAANLAGVSNEDVAFTMNSLLSGAYLTTYREGDHTVPVMLRSRLEDRADISDTQGIFVTGANGKVPLDSLAKQVTTWQPACIARRNNRRTVEIGCRVKMGYLSNGVAEQIEPEVQKIVETMPPGSFYEVGGELEKTIDNGEYLGFSAAVALFAIILTLVIQYNSLLKPFIILFTLPLALIGVFVGLLASGWAMGFMPMLGILSLCGIVINNAIVLIDFVEGLIAGGTPLRDAVAQAGRLRLKPIVLTTLTTIGGLLPLALFGGPLWEGMSYAMMVGLGLATCLTLFVVPTLYVLFAERLKMRTS